MRAKIKPMFKKSKLAHAIAVAIQYPTYNYELGRCL